MTQRQGGLLTQYWDSGLDDEVALEDSWGAGGEGNELALTAAEPTTSLDGAPAVL